MRGTILAVSVLTLLIVSAGVRDAEAVRLGPLQVHPYIDVDMYYSDNIFTQNTGTTDDWYFQTSPGALFQLRQRNNTFEVEYKTDIYRYIETADANDVEDHFFRGAAYINFPGGLSLKVDDLGEKNHEQRAEQNFAVTTELSRYWSNALSAELGYKLSDRFSTAVTYESMYIDYGLVSNSFRDRLDNGVSGQVFYKFLPKTSAVVQGIYKNIDHFDHDSPFSRLLDSNEYWVMAGVTWDITAKSTGTVKAGYEWKKFKVPGRNDYLSPVYQVRLEHHFTPKTAITVFGSRQANETDFPSVPFYTSTVGGIMVELKPVRKLTVRPNASLMSNHYSGATPTPDGDFARRLDMVLSGGLETSYDMNRWLTISAGYTFTKRTSTQTFFDYTENKFMLRMRATL